MAEATKLFDKSGGAASGNKQDAVNGAAMTVMKLLVQSKFSGGIVGGNSGGMSGLMGLVSSLQYDYLQMTDRAMGHFVFRQASLCKLWLVYLYVLKRSINKQTKEAKISDTVVKIEIL